MIVRDDALALLNGMLRGRVGRRELLLRAAALGLSAPVVSSLLGFPPAAARAQDGTPAAEKMCSGSITWALESDPANLIPFGATAGSNMWGKEFMYDSLLEWDKDLKIHPALAESYEAAPDATSYTFHLRHGVLFHNGQEMKGADVKYSMEMAANPPPPGTKFAWFDNIASVDVVDDYTVKFTMSKSDPTIPGVLAWQRYCPIVPAGIADQINWLSEGIGTGPYRLIEYVSNDRVAYTCNPDYWKPGVPCIKDLTLKILTDEQSRVAALRSGEIDGGTLSADVAKTLQNDESLEVLEGLFAAPRVIQFNMTKEAPWRDARVRQAVNLAIDRQEIIDNVYGGVAELTAAIAPGYGDWPLPKERLQELYKPDPERAKALLQEAGVSGFDVTLQAIADPRDYTQIAEIVRERLRPLNINVTVQPLEIGTFASNISDGSFEWASTGRGMRGDPSGFVVDFRNGTANNKVWFGDGWKNDELDKLYDEALATSDQAKRHEDYARIQEIIAEEVPNLYTVQPYKFQVVNKRVSGMYVAYTDFNTGLRMACVTE